MQGSASPLLYNHSSIIQFTNLKTTTLSIPNHPTPGTPSFSPKRRKVSASSHNFPVTEFNLYELLGIDASSDTRQIKEAYRALQKRCHPDIAGPPGHDMAIVLNEAYALLCDPNSRMAYDKELAKVVDIQGYTGKPIYSVWIGAESEERAVFVDEVKCVGCLKCALFAEKTFAVESVYGRARVVAQWADPEPKIQEAIGACPVDCISIVERADLAALEFIMSKQPRGRVRVGAGNTTGARTADVFDEVKKFKARYAAQHKDSQNYPQESSRTSAIQAIQMISNWLYWQSPTTEATSLAIHIVKRGTTPYTAGEPSLKKLKAAADARKRATKSARTVHMGNPTDEYWVPPALALPHATTAPDFGSKSQVSPTRKMNRTTKTGISRPKVGARSALHWGVPMGTSIVAALIVWLQLGEATGGGLEGHIGGSLALAIVNSSWMQVGLAGVTWYLVGTYVVEMVEALRRK